MQILPCRQLIQKTPPKQQLTSRKKQNPAAGSHQQKISSKLTNALDAASALRSCIQCNDVVTSVWLLTLGRENLRPLPPTTLIASRHSTQGASYSICQVCIIGTSPDSPARSTHVMHTDTLRAALTDYLPEGVVRLLDLTKSRKL